MTKTAPITLATDANDGAHFGASSPAPTTAALATAARAANGRATVVKLSA